MEAVFSLLTTDSAAHTVLIIALVGAIGLTIGSIRVFGINIGVAGVLFAGLIFGHFKLTVNEQLLEFLRDFAFPSGGSQCPPAWRKRLELAHTAPRQ